MRPSASACCRAPAQYAARIGAVKLHSYSCDKSAFPWISPKSFTLWGGQGPFIMTMSAALAEG